MNAESNKTIEPNHSQTTKRSIDISRRSFAKVGVGMLPVMMTLANRSAWGGTNVCTQSGFVSFQAQNGVVSHSANEVNPNWKTPSGWAGSSTWPTGFGPATYDPTNNKFTSPLWSGSKSLSHVQQWEGNNGTKVLAHSVFSSVTDTTLTLLALLGGNDLLAYRTATLLNNVLSPVPSYFLTDQALLGDFQTFYATCVV